MGEVVMRFSFLVRDFAKWSKFLLQACDTSTSNLADMPTCNMRCKYFDPATGNPEKVALSDFIFNSETTNLFESMLGHENVPWEATVEARVLLCSAEHLFFNLLPRVDLSVLDDDLLQFYKSRVATKLSTVQRCYSAVATIVLRIRELCHSAGNNTTTSYSDCDIDFTHILFILNRVNSIFPIYRLHYCPEEQLVHVQLQVTIQESPDAVFRAESQIRLEITPRKIYTGACFSKFDLDEGFRCTSTVTGDNNKGEGARSKTTDKEQRNADLGCLRLLVTKDDVDGKFLFDWVWCTSPSSSVSLSGGDARYQTLQSDLTRWKSHTSSDVEVPIFRLQQPFTCCLATTLDDTTT